jgi:hypothetical protein
VHSLTVYNVNDALPFGLSAILRHGIVNQSRNGKVMMVPAPVTTAYLAPCERVLFSPERDANPFFHLMESMWMLAGCNDVAFPSYYSKQLASYSVDGQTLHGAYGHRWRNHFGYDQIEQAIADLKADPDSRRVIIQMWDATVDGRSTEANAKDRPCNDMVKFQAIPAGNGYYCLNMSVFCRSNDAVWGAYGANAVHFSYLHEYVASAVGMSVGTYFQISDNLHVYDQNLYGEALFNRLMNTSNINPETGFPAQVSDGLEKAVHFTRKNEAGEEVGEFTVSQYNLYTLGKVTFASHPFTIVQNYHADPEVAQAHREAFDIQLPVLLDNTDAVVTHPFLKLVIQPLMKVYQMYKNGSYLAALSTLRDAEIAFEAQAVVPEGEDQGSRLLKRVNQNGERLDWFASCEDWLMRRPSVQKAVADLQASIPVNAPVETVEDQPASGTVVTGEENSSCGNDCSACSCEGTEETQPSADGQEAAGE